VEGLFSSSFRLAAAAAGRGEGNVGEDRQQARLLLLLLLLLLGRELQEQVQGAAAEGPRSRCRRPCFAPKVADVVRLPR
jgi:hypothetical protein